ncbi:hypothetical protein NC652_014436 [Populus alba x Populus x berolinensis]|nr:hypothetical protein NC652_014436 [Populus alba x Populus x berolinensis]
MPVDDSSVGEGKESLLIHVQTHVFHHILSTWLLQICKKSPLFRLSA